MVSTPAAQLNSTRVTCRRHGLQQHSRRVPTIANVALDRCLLRTQVPWQHIAEEVLDSAELHLSGLAVLGESRLQLRPVGAIRIVLQRTWPHSQSAVAN